MNEVIKSIKNEQLEKLKAQREIVFSKKSSVYEQKFASKKTIVDEECAKIDELFNKFKQDKVAMANEQINSKFAEVQNKKGALLKEAQASAEAEANSEISFELAEYDSEIAKLEKELKE